MDRYSLYTVTLRNKETEEISWPCMLITTPYGEYVDNEAFGMSSNNYIVTQRKSGASCIMYLLNGKYEVARKVKFGFVKEIEQ